MFDPTKSSSAPSAAPVNYEGAAQEALLNSNALSMSGDSSRLNGQMLAEPYDAVTVTCELSSERPIENPYIVIIMRFLENKDRKDTAKTWIYGEELPGIDQYPRPCRIVRAGFPQGYQIESYHVHLYEHGREIATNVSPKEIALTADEAFQYTVVQHITANRNQTTDPAKARGYWPANLARRFTPNQLNQTVYIKVAKDGRALGIYQDEKCSRLIADQEIAALAPELRFLPALEKGKPVEGVAMGKLALGN